MNKNKLFNMINERIHDTWKLQFCLTFLILHDKFNFNADMLEQYAEELQMSLDTYHQRYFSLADLASTVKEETGIDISSMVVK